MLDGVLARIASRQARSTRVSSISITPQWHPFDGKLRFVKLYVMNIWRRLLSLVVVLAPGLYFGLFKGPAEMGIAVVAGALAAAFMNIDQFQSFKGAGFEAVTKKAESVIAEGAATIESLKIVAEALIFSSLEIMAREGVWGGIDRNVKHKIVNNLLDTAGKIGIADKTDILNSKDNFYNIMTWQIWENFVSSINDQSLQGEIRKSVTFAARNFPDREAVTAFLKDYPLNQDQKERLEDYLHYRVSHALRRENAVADG